MIPTKIKLTLTLVLALGLCFAGSDTFTVRAEKPKGDDKAAIEAKTEALMTASQKLGEKVYAASQAEAAAAAGAAGGAEQASAGASSSAKDDDIVDAEVKEVKKG